MKKFIKRMPYAHALHGIAYNFFLARKRKGQTKINLIEEFKLHAPSSAGSYRLLEPIIIKSIKSLIPNLTELGCEHLTVKNLAEIPSDTENLHAKSVFDKYGSDKATTHQYYKLYAIIKKEVARSKANILEIGMGTTNSNVPSNMGKGGKPGASLRAFREIFPGTLIYGADIDKSILFKEEGIETFWLDQLDRSTIKAVMKKAKQKFKLIIDDGLHTPLANLNVLMEVKDYIEEGGFLVIEDIHEEALPFWTLVDQRIQKDFETTMYRSETSYIYACRRR